MIFDLKWRERSHEEKMAILNSYTVLCTLANHLLKLDAIPKELAGSLLDVVNMVTEADRKERYDDEAQRAKLN
jgi:hypothetical protein